MTVYSYIMVHDRGYAPNPYHNIMSLAVCKGQIRNKAQKGDVIIAFAGTNISKTPILIYAMVITEKVPFWEYMSDTKYSFKAPQYWRHTGDRIYVKKPDGVTAILRSWHTEKDGTPIMEEVLQDLNGKFVLLSEQFWYFGNRAPSLTKDLEQKYYRKMRQTHIVRENGDDIINYLTTNYGNPSNQNIYGIPFHLWDKNTKLQAR